MGGLENVLPSAFLDALQSESMGWIRLGLIGLVFVSVLMALLRRVLIFHSDFIRHRKVKNIDFALKMLEDKSVEARLLSELKRQELLAINTGLRFAQADRTQILEWIETGVISINLISKARAHIWKKNGARRLRVWIPWYEKLIAAYFLFCGLVLWGFSALPLLVGTESSLSIRSGQFGLVLLIGGSLTGLFVAVQARSVYYAILLRNALESAGLQPAE